MSRAPDQLAPSWLPRQQRRRIDRELHKLLRRDVCSICGSTFKHNSRTASGFDAHGNVAVAGECCIDRVVEIFGLESRTRVSHADPASRARFAVAGCGRSQRQLSTGARRRSHHTRAVRSGHGARGGAAQPRSPPRPGRKIHGTKMMHEIDRPAVAIRRAEQKLEAVGLQSASSRIAEPKQALRFSRGRRT